MPPFIIKRTSLRNELMLLLLGILQFGIVFHQYITVTDAVRAGARKAVVSRHDSNPAATAEAAVRKAAGGLDAAKLSVSVSTPAGWSPAEDVTVCASYPYKIDLIGMVFKSGNFNSCTTERIE
jgi:Flp pilus assembly protein TadG